MENPFTCWVRIWQSILPHWWMCRHNVHSTCKPCQTSDHQHRLQLEHGNALKKSHCLHAPRKKKELWIIFFWFLFLPNFLICFRLHLLSLNFLLVSVLGSHSSYATREQILHQEYCHTAVGSPKSPANPLPRAHPSPGGMQYPQKLSGIIWSYCFCGKCPRKWNWLNVSK